MNLTEKYGDCKVIIATVIKNDTFHEKSHYGQRDGEDHANADAEHAFRSPPKQ